MKVTEIFDTSMDITWQVDGRYKLFLFMYNEIQYAIQIEKKPLHGIDELKGKNTAEISFYRTKLDNESAHSTTNDIDLPYKIYGVVTNALADEYKHHDAFFFSALSRHSNSQSELESKAKIYFFLADRVAKRIGGKVYDSKDHHGYEFIISKIKIDNSNFIDEQLVALSKIDVNTIPNIKTKR